MTKEHRNTAIAKAKRLAFLDACKALGASTARHLDEFDDGALYRAYMGRRAELRDWLRARAFGALDSPPGGVGAKAVRR